MASTLSQESWSTSPTSLSQATSYSDVSTESPGSGFGNIITVPQTAQTGAAITKIESILKTILDGLSNGAETLTLPIRSRPQTLAAAGHVLTSTENGTASNLRQPRVNTQVSYPGSTEEEARRFSM